MMIARVQSVFRVFRDKKRTRASRPMLLFVLMLPLFLLSVGIFGLEWFLRPIALAEAATLPDLPPPPNPLVFGVEIRKAGDANCTQDRFRFSTNQLLIYAPNKGAATTTAANMYINGVSVVGASSTVCGGKTYTAIPIQGSGQKLNRGMNELEVVYTCNGSADCAGSSQVVVRKNFVYAYPWVFIWDGSVFMGPGTIDPAVDLQAGNHDFASSLNNGNQPPAYKNGSSRNIFGVYQSHSPFSTWDFSIEEATNAAEDLPLPEIANPFQAGSQYSPTGTSITCGNGPVTINALAFPFIEGSCTMLVRGPVVQEFPGQGIVGAGNTIVIGGDIGAVEIQNLTLLPSSNVPASLSIYVVGNRPLVISGDIVFNTTDGNGVEALRNSTSPTSVPSLSIHAMNNSGTGKIIIKKNVSEISGVLQADIIEVEGGG